MTVPPGDSASPMMGPERHPQSVEFSWDVDSRLPWDRYVESVTTTTEPQFHRVQREASHLVLSQYRDGDAYRLDLKLVEGSPFTHVHVTLVISPD